MAMTVYDVAPSSRVVDYVSENLPMPVEIIGTGIDVSLSGESTYIDTRKGSWVTLSADGGNDAITPISASMPSNAVALPESVNGYTVKAVFSTSGQTCYVYPLVSDASGNYPGYLPSVELVGLYENADGKYESEIAAFDTYGFGQLAVLKSGISSGTAEILGVPY